eukprot:scaffold1175_cov248-Pinguiococcus_pyrenoidosus.AAC.16
MSGLNPNASSFSFNPGASSWTPGAPTEAQAPPAEEPAVAPEAQDNAEEVDEDDPLWKVTLQLANGDRQQALQMLEDPDALMRR